MLGAGSAPAELARRVDVFDRRGLAEPDGFRTTRTWLQAFGRLSGQAAGRLVAATRLLRRLPQLASAAQSGQASPEHLQQVTRLATQVGAASLTQIEATLADAAGVLDPARFSQLCARIQATWIPTGPTPPRSSSAGRWP